MKNKFTKMFCSFFDLVLEYIVKILFPWSYLGYCSCSSPSPPLSVVSSFICNSHLLACIRFWVPVTLWSIYFSSIKSELYTKRWKSVPSSCPSHPIPIFFSPCIRLLPVVTHLFLVHPSGVYMCVLYKWADTHILAYFPFFLPWKGGYHRYQFMLWSFT